MKSSGPISFKWKALAALLILVVPLLIFICSFAVYTIRQQNDQLCENAENALFYHQNALEADAQNISTYLSNLLSMDPDFQQLCYRRSYSDAHFSSYNLVQKFKLQLKGTPSLGALFILTPENNLFRGAYNVENYPLETKEEILAFLKECAALDGNYSTNGWVLREMCGQAFLFRFFGRNGTHTYCVAMLDLNRAIAAQKADLHADPADAFAFFSTSISEEKVIPLNSRSLFEETGIVLHAQEDGYWISGDTQKYLIVQRPMNGLGISIGYATPYFGLLSGMDGVQITLLLLCCVLVGLIPMFFLLLQKSLFDPVQEMTRIIEKLGDGDLYIKMDAPFSIWEFERVRIAFNRMVERIRQLKITSYEKELEAKHAKLQYLQLQIRPHFYLNCLKNLYALAEARQYHSIQNTILALSGYLRFIFRDNMKRIPLSQELRSIRDYMQLQTLCNANPPCCKMDIDADLEDFLIPPLSLVTFVENSVQHGTTLDHTLVIRIRVSRIRGKDGDYVSLLISNNGPAFPDFILQEAAEPEPQIYRSQHVGINNIRYRLHLLYGETAALSLYNSAGFPCAELFLPGNDSNIKEEDIT